MHPRLLGISADVGAHSLEELAIDIDPRVARRVRRSTQDIGTVVDAVEVDALPVVADPIVRWRLKTNHGGQRRPAIDMRHHLVVLNPCRNVIRPPHDAWHTPAAFEGRAFLAAERYRAGI